MRISDKYKLIFISIPKTGTHTGLKLMEKEFNGVLCGSMHNVKVPHNKLHYTAFTFVRNPYDRAVSIWNSILQRDPNKYEAIRERDIKNMSKVIGGTDFKPFCLWLKKHNISRGTHFSCRTQAEHLKTFNVKPHLIRTENMLEELNSLLLSIDIPIINEVPHELKRSHKSFWELADQECLEAINMWARNDFELGNYEICHNLK